MTFGTFFLPGPTEVRREVLAAMLQPMIPHRGAAFSTLFESVQLGLQVVFQTTRPVLISTSSATGLMEAAIRCAPEGPILSLVNGAFSERFARIAEACGRSVDRYVVEWGDVHDPEQLAERLRARHYAAITVVHSETSTGALNPIRALSDTAHAHNTMCLIDSVSGMGGVEVQTDAWNLDFILTGSQKALALPPGLAFAVASEEFLAQAADRNNKGVYFDLSEFAAYAANAQAPNTPAISLYYALERQLEDILQETMPVRWARHTAMAGEVHRWVEEIQASGIPDFTILAPAGSRSPTVTTFTLPSNLSSQRVVNAMAAHGMTIGTGYGKLKDTTIRIGHMGDHTVDGVRRCLTVCGEVLRALMHR
jgi:aspartate aminotransferase-like enzyme